ncbi:MAG: hypothetical protein DRN29_02490 [Thermoplasmata archaeon]|nr:MAG: hypothetical protein DRN29_02490 [Thermoplasmata archaeon]
MMKRAVSLLIVISFFLLSAHSAACASESSIEKNDEPHNVDEWEKVNHDCLVYGIGYIADFNSYEDALFWKIVWLLEHFMRMTDVAFMTVLIAYALIINNIPGISFPYTPSIFAMGLNVGYVATIGKNGSWEAGHLNEFAYFNILEIKGFAGLWMQIPIIVYPKGYPFCLDVFVGYAKKVRIGYTEWTR